MQKFAIAALTALLTVGAAQAYSTGHENDPPEWRAWFPRQKQPDTGISCCGDYDAYWADAFVVRGDQYFAIITDGKGEIADGTEVLIPPNKLRQDNRDGNPTGHGIVFMSLIYEHDVARPGNVYCYFSPSLS